MEPVAYEFGDFRLEIVPRRLYRGEKLIPLAKLRWDLLLYLVQNNPRPIPVKELEDHLYPGGTGDLLARLNDVVRNLHEDLGYLNQSDKLIQRKNHEFRLTINVYPEFDGQVDHPSESVTSTPVASNSLSIGSEESSKDAESTGGTSKNSGDAEVIGRSHGWRANLSSPVVGRICTVVGSLLIAGSVGQFLYRLVVPEQPSQSLVVGLAVFSPDTPVARQLRQRIALALERREYGGPALQVQLLDGELNAAESDLQLQARTLSRNRVNIVIGATAVDDTSFLPRTVVVRDFGLLAAGRPLLWEELRIRLKPTADTYGDAAAPIADLIKMLYGLQYFALVQPRQMAAVLNDLNDRNLGLVVLADLLWEVSDFAEYDEGINRLAIGQTILDSILNNQDQQLCGEISDANLTLCLGVAVRSEVAQRLAQRTAPNVAPELLDSIRKDNDRAISFFRRARNQRVLSNLLFERAQLFSLIGYVYGFSKKDAESESAYLESKAQLEDLLNHNSQYGIVDAHQNALIRGELSHALNELAKLDRQRPGEVAMAAYMQAKEAARGCSEEIQPSQAAGGLGAFIQKLWGSRKGSACQLSDDAWAQLKNLEGEILDQLAKLSAGSVRQDYIKHAILSYQTALKVLSERRSPTQWARCNYDLSLALINASFSPSRSSNRAQLKMAVACATAALKILTKEHFPGGWASAKISLAVALVRRSYVADNADEGMRDREDARKVLSDVRLQIGPEAFRKLLNNIPADVADLGRIL